TFDGLHLRRNTTPERCNAVITTREVRAIHQPAPTGSSSKRICFCALLATPRPDFNSTKIDCDRAHQVRPPSPKRPARAQASDPQARDHQASRHELPAAASTSEPGVTNERAEVLDRRRSHGALSWRNHSRHTEELAGDENWPGIRKNRQSRSISG